MFALRGEAELHAVADWIVAMPGGGDGGAGAFKTGVLNCNGIGKVKAGALKAATLLGSARFEGASVLDCWAEVAGAEACCCEPKWLLVAASIVADVGPKWPVAVFELSSGWLECTGTGGAEAALSEPPSDVAVAHAGGSPRDDWGRLAEDSTSS